MGRVIYMLEYMNHLYTQLKTQEEQISFLRQFEQKRTESGIIYFVRKE
jgi:hypothetical protein